MLLPIIGFISFFFFVPLAGFDGLIGYMHYGYLYALNTDVAVKVSLIMALLGIIGFIIYRRRKQVKGKET